MIGAAVGTTATDLVFSDDSEYRMVQHALTAMVGYRLASGWSVRGAIGAVLGGDLELDSAGSGPPGAPVHDLGTGVLVSLTAARLWTFGAGNAWFATGSLTAAAAYTRTRERDAMDAMMDDSAGFTGTDLRLGAMVGRRLFGVWQPYVLARGFGGPIFWTVEDRDLRGTDQSHFQLGVGSSVATPFGLVVVADVSLLGERSASLGVSWLL